MTAEEFAAKVDWEGGVSAALEYGLKASQLSEDGPLKKAWEKLEDVYRLHYQPAEREVEALLDEIEEG